MICSKRKAGTIFYPPKQPARKNQIEAISTSCSSIYRCVIWVRCQCNGTKYLRIESSFDVSVEHHVGNSFLPPRDRIFWACFRHTQTKQKACLPPPSCHIWVYDTHIYTNKAFLLIAASSQLCLCPLPLSLMMNPINLHHIMGRHVFLMGAFLCLALLHQHDDTHDYLHYTPTLTLDTTLNSQTKTHTYPPTHPHKKPHSTSILKK